MVASGVALQEILAAVSLSVEARIPGIHCAFFLLDSEECHLQLAAGPSLPPELAEAVAVRTVSPDFGSAGPVGSRASPVAFSEELTGLQPAGTGGRGGPPAIRGCCSIPIVNHHGSVLGALSAYHGESAGPTPDEMLLLGSAARLGGIAMQRDRADAVLREAEIQLSQSQKVDTIGQLAGEIVHDFNNMLTTMSAYLSMVDLDDGDKGPQAEAMRGTMKVVERATQLTRQLLRFSRKDEIRFQKVDLNQIVADLAVMFRRLFDARILLEIHPSSRGAVVQGDRGMLDQIITNLTLNARDSMPQGGRLALRVDIVTFGMGPGQRRSQTKSGNYVCLSVSDSGCGIPPQHMRRIFEPFYTTKGEGKGTGLGLATVLRLVQRHCGWIELDSQLGKGSNFHVFLPLIEDVTGAPAEPGESGRAA
jgi:signal transduction histidine kinase